MGRFNNERNDGRKFDNKRRFDNNRNNMDNKHPFKKEKPKFTKIKVAIADSDYYASSVDSLYNILCSISFDKVAIPVYMNKSELFGKADAKGTAMFGTIDKFNNDNTFTVLVQDTLADKFIEGKHVMSIKCKKDYDTGEITYIISFNIVQGTSISSHYDDIEQAMLDKAEAEDEATTEE